jgi:hypothetical protein
MLYLTSNPLDVPHEQGDVLPFVEAAGYILGAASCCSDIDRARILVAIQRVKEVLELSPAADTGVEMYDAAFHEGVKAIGSGQLDRMQARNALSMLERMIGR